MKPRRNEPAMLSALMLANLAVFLLSSLQELATGVPTMIIDWGLIPERLTDSLLNGSLGEIGYNLLTIFTCTFLHGGVDHFFNNMLLLLIFGAVVERDFGSARFALIYLVSGIAGSMAHYFFHVFNQHPMIGASGAISGILGAFLVSVFARGNRISLLRVIGAVFVVQWLFEQVSSILVNSGVRSDIAHGAHLGGFFCGLLLTIMLVRMIRTTNEAAQAAVHEIPPSTSGQVTTELELPAENNEDRLS